MVFLSKVLPPKIFPFKVNYPVSQLTRSTQKGTEALEDWVFPFLFPFSLSTTCTSLCIYGGASCHFEDIPSCSVGITGIIKWVVIVW